jgi:hypothetical protein
LKSYSLSLEQAITAKKEAKSSLREGKLKAAKWRKGHNLTIGAALAKAKGTNIKTEKKNLNCITAQRQQAQLVCCMNGKF